MTGSTLNFQLAGQPKRLVGEEKVGEDPLAPSKEIKLGPASFE